MMLDVIKEKKKDCKLRSEHHRCYAFAALDSHDDEALSSVAVRNGEADRRLSHFMVWFASVCKRGRDKPIGVFRET